MMCKVAIIILHYESLDDTRACLDSLLKYLYKDEVQVVVIDNGSKNEKLSEIESLYKNNEQITFIILKENLGFARGNNVGFLYAKENFNPDIIVLANNDLIFNQVNFVEELLRAETVTQFDVAGPQIISMKDGKNQNPVGLVYKKSGQVKCRIFKLRCLYLLSYFHLDYLVKSVLSHDIPEYHIKKGEDFQLHGACMFFSNRYLERFDGLYDGTFMYGEEFILKHIVQRNNMKMSYLNNLCVLHKEGVATHKKWGVGKRQRQFFYKWSINSLNLLCKMMTDDEREKECK